MAEMIDRTEVEGLDQPGVTPAIKKDRSKLWQRAGLTVVMVLSVFMNFYQLGKNGFGNLYYAAGVRSMLDSLHNFFFVAYDPGAFITIDKPPLGFWLQTISAKVFGFTAFSVLLPQALAGVLSVLVLYHLVKRHFGVVAGLLAALALAISPISVVTNRNNTIDSTLVLVMLLGAWTVMKAAETGKWRWLLLTATLVGLGFNIKMMEAYLVVPAYGLLYLLSAPRSIKMRIAQLLVAVVLMVSVSLSWALVVDAIPASQRPYVGSSQDNSEISLALGYNGVQRLLGSFFGRGGGNADRTAAPASTQNSITQPVMDGTGQQPGQNANGGTFQPPDFANGGQAPQGGGGMFNTGTPGPFRLFTEPLGGQIAWLLPFALLGAVALAWQRRPHFREDRQQQSLILWGTWLLTVAIFFSVAGFFHQYYLSTLAPAICALFGIGAVMMWQDYRREGWRGWLLPLAIVLTAAEQIFIIVSNPAWGMWLVPVIALACGIVAVVLLVARLRPQLEIKKMILIPACALSLAVLLLTSAVWTAIPVLAGTASSLPTAGPEQGFGMGMRVFDREGQAITTGQPPLANRDGEEGNVNTALVRYLEEHQGQAKYLVAVSSANQANSIILATNKPVMAMGGFSGSDPALTVEELQTLVKNGTVRYFLMGGMGGGRGGPGGQLNLTTWVESNCSAVPASEWASSTTGSSSNTSSNLYACGTSN